MFKDKFKAYKFSIIVSIFNSILTGICYILFEIPAMGIAFIITSIASIITIICYNIDKRKK
ncbi:hypothetical protein [Petroclostridium xylanilyticum]|jgi:hypothetical protein|uniref:hypothetical protein n=1 Tax=Petroclostridium xylanilyticum TaxID=1792311 RepID=UPI000B97D82A|nr:hypothetical protein [Petroclostridium xylanilyticum]